MEFSKTFTDNNEYKRVSVNLSKCDDLIRKFHSDELQSQFDSITSVNHLRKSDVAANSNLNNQTPSKIMSISELFDAMIMSTRNMEPKQFCLPTDYLVNTNLSIPSTESDFHHSNKETEGNESVKLPHRKCYYCEKICSSSDIVSCDFCPGHFHINCLSPPLCCIPDVKWMCPLHPQHCLTKVMARSYSVTEMTFWWNQVHASDNDGSVENDFIQKTNSKRKRQSMNSRVSHSVKIPEVVKYHYEHFSTPPSISQELIDSRIDRIFRNNPFMIPRRSISKIKHKKVEKKPEEEFNVRSDTLIEITNDDDPRSSGNSNMNLLLAVSGRSAKSEDYSLWDNEKMRFKFESHGIYEYDCLDLDLEAECKENNLGKRPVPSNQTSGSQKETNNLNRKNFSWRRLRQIIDDDIQKSFNKGKPVPGETELTRTLKERLNAFKLHSIIGSYPPSFIPNTHPYPFNSPSVGEPYLLPSKPVKKVHAVLCPLSHQAHPVYMYHNILKVGTNVRNDVHLTKYGSCEFISDHHATIFFDEFTDNYELLNRSEYNCVVDGVCYTSDLSRKPPKTNVCRWTYSNDMNNSLREDGSRKVLPVIPMNGIKKLPKRHSKTLRTAINKNKRFQSKITSREREWRYTQQKLLQEIEKLVTRSQKEMTLVANEDLNEISKVILKNRKSTAVVEEDPEYIKIIRDLMDRLFSESNEEHSEGKCTQKSSCKENQIIDAQEVAPVVSVNETDRLCSMRQCGVRMEPTQSTCVNGPGTNDEEPKNQPIHRDHIPAAYQAEKNCACQILNSEFPIGNDSSWEGSVPLHHGSYIRFGCIEFVFCIVDRSTISKESFDEPEEVVPSFQRNVSESRTVLLDGASTRQTEDSDLSSKLTSILTILSSDSEVREESSSLTSSVPFSTNGEGREQMIEISDSTNIGSDEANSTSSYSGSVDSAANYSDETENQLERKRLKIK